MRLQVYLFLFLFCICSLSYGQTKTMNGRIHASGKIIGALSNGFVSYKQGNTYAIVRFDGKLIQEDIQASKGILSNSALEVDYGVYFERVGKGYVLKSLQGEQLNETTFSKFKPFKLSNTVAEITDAEADRSYVYLDTCGRIFAQYDLERYYRIFGVNIHEGFHNTDGYKAKSLLFTDDNFRLYSEGLLALQHPENGLWGFVDSAMRLQIEPQFADVGPFMEGKATFKSINGLWGYIDTQGNVMIEPRFSMQPSGFSSQRARIQGEQGLFGYIDRAGNWIIEPQYASATNFYKGFALVRTNADAPICLIDRTGTVLAQFDSKYQYFDSDAGKGMWNAKENPFHTAETLIQLVDMGKGVFHNGKHYGILSKSGAIVLPFQYAYIKDYAEGKLLGVRSSFLQGKLKNEYYLMNDKGEAYIKFTGK